MEIIQAQSALRTGLDELFILDLPLQCRILFQELLDLVDTGLFSLELQFHVDFLVQVSCLRERDFILVHSASFWLEELLGKVLFEDRKRILLTELIYLADRSWAERRSIHRRPDVPGVIHFRFLRGFVQRALHRWMDGEIIVLSGRS